MQTLALTSLKQIIIMFLIILVGIVCYKIKMIDNDFNKRLSNLVLMLINPIVIFISYQREFNITLLKGLIISIILAVVTHLLGILLGILLIRGKRSKEALVMERFAAVYSNCGFIGIPLAQGMLGSEGVFYITAYMTVFNLFLWTHGVIIMTGKRDIKAMLKALTSSSVIATVSGFLFFILRINLPDILSDTLNYIGDMNTPLAMLVSGVTIAQTNLRKLLLKPRSYYIASIRLILIPVLVLLIYRMFHIPNVVLLTAILSAATPTAASINLFALRFGKNYIQSSELFAMTTLLSAISIPSVMAIAGLLV